MDIKKYLIIFVLVGFLVMTAVPVMADEGLIPCGRNEDNPGTADIDETADCTLCHLAILINNLIDKFVTYIAVPFAIVMLAIYAFKLITAKGDAGAITQAKGAMTRIIIGLLFILGAWIIIDYIVQAIVNPAVLPHAPWNEIKC